MNLARLPGHLTSYALLLGASVSALLLGDMTPASAHPTFQRFIAHDLRLQIGADAVDVVARLTFYEQPSLRERRRMDLDRNGRISTEELDHYSERLGPQLASQLHLTVAGQRLPLIALYPAEVDLLGNRGVVPAHHLLALHCFSRLPSLKSGPTVGWFADGTYPEVPALAQIEATVQPGLQIRAESPPRGHGEGVTARREARIVFPALAHKPVSAATAPGDMESGERAVGTALVPQGQPEQFGQLGPALTAIGLVALAVALARRACRRPRASVHRFPGEESQ